VYLRAPVPIEHFELLVEWEPGVEPPVWLSGEPDASCAPVGPRGLRCTRERVPALETDPDVRSYLDVTPTLVVRSPQTWSEIAGVELAQLETALASTPELDAQARSLAKGAGSSREILGRIQRFVSDQIRYVGEEQGIWAVRPHPAAQTLQRRFGDCKDKVALFVALARRAGLEAEGVLVSTQHFSLDSLIAPSFSWFDHMIACAQGTDLERRCVDLTDPDTASGELPAMVAGAVALDLRPGAEQPYTLERPRFGARASLKTERRLNCDGSIEERNVRSFGGALDTAFRAGLRPRVQQERVRFAVESYEEIVGKTEAIKSTLRHVDDVKGPVEIEDEVRLKARVNWAELSEYAALDRWLQALAQEVASNNKHHARDGAGLEFESETSFEICDRYVVESVGPSLDFQHPLGALSRSYARTAKGVVVRTRLAVPGARIPPEDLARLNRLVEIFLENGEVSFTVKPR
jgi:hypothetical protein